MRSQFPHFSRVVPASGLILSTVAFFGFTLNASAAPPASSPQTLNVGEKSGPPPAGPVNVLTYHDDNMRTGQNTQETMLTQANVNSSSFGKLNFLPVDGKVDAEPLYVASEKIQGGTYNVLYVVTEHDSAYAFDADTGKVLWQVSALGSGEATSDPRNCGQVTPEIGITSTPVIDLQATPHGAMYVVAASKDSQGNYHQRLHALDLWTGQELAHSPVEIQATYPGNGPASANGVVGFDPSLYNARAALLELNGTVYLSWSSHCDQGPYTGWVMGYDSKSLNQTSVLNLTPNGLEGSVWQSGAGPAADSAGNIYFLDANGTFDTTLNAQGFPSGGDYGNSFMKLSTAGNRLAVADYFTMSNTVSESFQDQDLGSGGALVLPNLYDGAGRAYHLAVGAGKDGNVYVVNRDNMGKFNPNGNNIALEMAGGLGGPEYGMPAYWNNHVYYGAVGDVIRSFTTSITGQASRTAHSFGYPGTTPGVSSNGGANGIVWAVDSGTPAILYAFDATNVSRELYDSNQAGGRDQFGPGNKFITPLVVNGKVFVGTQNGVAVFGLLQ